MSNIELNTTYVPVVVKGLRDQSLVITKHHQTHKTHTYSIMTLDEYSKDANYKVMFPKQTLEMVWDSIRQNKFHFENNKEFWLDVINVMWDLK